jgi:cysteine-rich repeat protein
MQRFIRSWALCVGFSLVGCAKPESPPAPAELRQALPEGCTTFDETPMTEHSCGHAEFGPFSVVSASVSREFPAASPNVNSVHTHYTVTLPPGGSEGTVKYRPQRSGEWAFYVAPATPVTLLDATGSSVPVLMQQPIHSCSLLNHAYVFNLTALATYRLVLGSSGSAAPAVVIEKLDDFQTFYFADSDGDGFGNPEDVLATMCESPAARVTDDTDCNDGNASIHPSAPEICDELDNDCDGQTDEGLDCNVCVPAEEVCDGADNDCDGQVDEGLALTTCGVGSCAATGTSCDPASCAPEAPSAETCNGIDDDCDNQIDDGAGSTFYIDRDGDGFGETGGPAVIGCAHPVGYAAQDGDCYDFDPAINPGTSELCGNAQDDDCSGYEDDAPECQGTCGNGIEEGEEECDDLNTSSGDGCSATCRLECTDIGRSATGHTCGHAKFGPFQAVSAQPYPGFIYSDVNSTHTHFTVTLPGAPDANESAVLYMPVVTGAFALYSKGNYPMRVIRTSDQADVPPRYENAVSTCGEELTWFRVYDLVGGDDYHVVFGPMGESSAIVVIEYLASLAEFTYYTTDRDGDGFGEEDTALRSWCPMDFPNFIAEGGDCDAENAAIHPGAAELCDGLDNDCNTVADDLFWAYDDADGDGTGDPFTSAPVCELPAGKVENGDDCDDTNPAVYGGATEICGNGQDEDCDAEADEAESCSGGCEDAELGSFYPDDDGDGAGRSADVVTACEAPAGHVETGGDCDDAHAEVYPGAAESCNGMDDDCDAEVDEGVLNTCGTCGMVPVETCDGIDNDCNGPIDEAGGSTFYADADGDGFGDPALPVVACVASPGYVIEGGDCDDGNAAVNPRAAESCNGLDDDCDGEADNLADPLAEVIEHSCHHAVLGPFVNVAAQPRGSEAIPNVNAPHTAYVVSLTGGGAGEQLVSYTPVETGDYVLLLDSDGPLSVETQAGVAVAIETKQAATGCGALSQLWVVELEAGQQYHFAFGASAAGSALLLVDALHGHGHEGQEDEAGTEAGTEFFRDADGDGHGTPADSLIACSAPDGYVTSSDDCNDAEPSVYDGAAESCDCQDNDCDGEIDEAGAADERVFYRDADGDGHGSDSDTVTDCAAPDGFVAVGGDCNDAEPSVHPGAEELCNAVDDDCDGTADSGSLSFYRDRDGDGYGDSSEVVQGCEAPAGYVSHSRDCNDLKASIHPGAEEICDQKDNDCDGAVDSIGGDSVCKCEPIVVQSIRSSFPPLSWDDTVRLDPGARVEIPATLKVVQGNAGKGEATLEIRKPGKSWDIECRYRAANDGKKYLLKSCTHGLRAGSSVEARRVTLELHGRVGLHKVRAELGNLSCGPCTSGGRP